MNATPKEVKFWKSAIEHEFVDIFSKVNWSPVNDLPSSAHTRFQHKSFQRLYATKMKSCQLSNLALLPVVSCRGKVWI